MEADSRSNRAAGAILATVGVLVLGLVAVAVPDVLPDLGANDEHLAGDALMAVVFGYVPLMVAGLLTLLSAWLLWRGRPGARVFASALVSVAGLFSWIMLTGFGNILWAVRIIVFEPDALLVRWPYLYYDPFVGSPGPGGFPVLGTPVEQLPSASLDNLGFWFPGIVAIGALAVAGLLLASGIATRARGARSG
jgi:hypothetical protein